MWIPVRILRLYLGLANNYLKVPKVPESFPNLPCPCKFGFTTYKTKKAKAIVIIAKVSEKLIHVLKLLALVCPKCIQFRFNWKRSLSKHFIIRVSSSKNKILSSILDEIFSQTNLTVFPLISVPGAYLLSKI